MDPIDRYLELLRARLAELYTNRVRAEVEGHLRDSARRHVSLGLSSHESAKRAVREFGPVELIATGFERIADVRDASLIPFARREDALPENVEVDVVAVREDPITDEERERWAQKGLPVPEGDTKFSVVLKERDGERELCIFIGRFEAASIALAREGTATSRPMTHDLFGRLLQSLDDLSIEHVVITKLEGETFYAEIALLHHGEPMTVDCRPSDAIAVAVRVNAPIYVSRDVPPFSQAA